MGMTSTRNTIAIALAAAALAFATAPAFAAPDEMGTCLSDMSAEWKPCQYDPSLPIQEDDPRWSCVDDGNRICGPGNSNGAPAGCYDDGGVLVANWPCYIVIDANGNADVYTPEVAHGVAAADGGVPGPGTGPLADAIDDLEYCGYTIDLSVRDDVDCD